MKNKTLLPRKILILRWIARIWSLVIFIFALIIIFSPDPYATGEPIPVTDYVLLGLWGGSVVGLLVAWLRERLGALIAIGTMLARELLFIIIEGRWYVNFLLIWAAFLPPAIIYLLAWRMERKLEEA
ncbi:MAG: hypothetical protein U9R53_01025 [Chloroflexota bacterium]|nr:hypothetical protein [Chloroflexota bacterium]